MRIWMEGEKSERSYKFAEIMMMMMMIETNSNFGNQIEFGIWRRCLTTGLKQKHEL